MTSQRQTTGSKSQNAWSVVARQNHRQLDEQVKQTEQQNIHQHQQRKIESLLQKMAKMEMENAGLKIELKTSDKLLAESTRKVEMVEKKLLAEEKIVEDIQAKEVAVIKNSLEFLKKFSFFVERDGFHVGLFGSLVRRVAEPRSRTIEEHERFMTEFKKSDMDVCVFSCTSENLPNLGKIVKRMEDMGMIFELDISSYKKFVPNSGQDDTEHMKFSLNFKGQKFALDLFNRKPTSDFFGGRDFTCNLLQIDGHNGSLVLPKEYQKPFATLDTLLEIGTKTAHPLFPKTGDMDSSHIARKVSKMFARQEKLVKTGYKVSPKLFGSTFYTSGKPCCVCYDKVSDKIDGGKDVPEHYIAPCLCGEGRNLCSECIEHLLDVRDFRCPGCRQTLQIHSEKEDEKGTESLIPDIVYLSISENNNGLSIPARPDWNAVPDAQLERRNELDAYFAQRMPLYEAEVAIWPPRN